LWMLVQTKCGLVNQMTRTEYTNAYTLDSVYL